MKSIKKTGCCRAILLYVLVSQAQWLSVVNCIAIDYCDSGLKSAGGNEIGYTRRGDRCEGIYIQEVGGEGLYLVSLTTEFQRFRFTNDHPLRLEWTEHGDAAVQMRASSLRRKLYYRMDTLQPQNPPNYTWPSEIISRLGLARDEIGILAWTEQPIAGVSRKIHLPLQVTPFGSGNSDSAIARQNDAINGYRVVFMSSVELQEVYVTLRPLDSQGGPRAPILQNAKLEYGFYPAERPVTFRIPFADLTNASFGLFSLSVGAELKNGGAAIAPEICFFHPSSAKVKPSAAGGEH